MPAPSTRDEFLDLIRKSGVVEEKRLQAHLDRLEAANQLPTDPARLAAQFVREGVLTHFQAEQFLQGKWRRFTIGKYKVLERLGAGGMGSVYLCEHMIMRRRVAVKVLPEKKGEDSSSLERFHREAKAIAALDHPNIVRAYDIDQDENLHFLVMEHVDGSSLQEIIKRGGAMDVLRAAHYVRQAALGLQHAHETAGLVHRDIKPANILVDRNGIVKILDMGLARFFHDEEDLLTKKYDENVLGTADYLAPEQALDSHGVDIRADIYSLGGTFYYCLTARTPFAEGTVAQKLIWHQTRKPKPILSIRPDVPEGIVEVVERMMAKDPAQRFQSPQEVADALAPWTQTPIPPPPESEMPQLSLAATRGSSPVSETGLSSGSRTVSDPLPSSPPRKQWQVSTGTPAPQPASPPPAPGPRSPAPAAVSRPVAPPLPAPKPPPGPVSRAPALASPPPAPRSAAAVQAPPVVRALPASVTPSPMSAEYETNGASRPGPALPAEVHEIDGSPETDFEEEDPLEELELSEPVSRRSRRDRADSRGRRSPVLWVALGAVALLGVIALVALVYVLYSRKPNNPEKGSPTKQVIRVKGGEPHALRRALLDARPGARIILQGDVTEANVVVKRDDITIEAEGNPAVWKLPADVADPSVKLLLVQGALGFKLRNVILDGDNRTEALVNLYGKCPGLKLENVVFRNTLRYGLLVTNCEGTKDTQVELIGVKFQTLPSQTAIRFVILEHSKKVVPTNRHFKVHDNCTFPAIPGQVTCEDEVGTEASSVTLPEGMTLETKR